MSRNTRQLSPLPSGHTQPPFELLQVLRLLFLMTPEKRKNVRRHILNLLSLRRLHGPHPHRFGFYKSPKQCLRAGLREAVIDGPSRADWERRTNPSGSVNPSEEGEGTA